MISKTRIRKRKAYKTNPELALLIEHLLKQKQQIWKSIAKDLARPRKRKICVNLYKINKLTKDDEVIIVPGKVLGKGELNHKLTIAAFTFSAKAKEKLEKKADLLSIPELLEKTSKFRGINIRIIT